MTRGRPHRRRYPAGVIVTAVVCPPAPLLVPGLADRLAGQAGDLRAACGAAVTALRDAEHVVIISAVATAAAGGTMLPGDLVTAAGLTRSDRPVVPPLRLPGASPDGTVDGGDRDPAVGAGRQRPSIAVGTAVGAWLLTAAGITAPTGARQLADTIDVQLPGTGRTGLLVMADGAACHGEHAPGAPDPRSEAFDADLVTALRSGDPAALAAACDSLANLAPALRADSLPALAAMAALTVANGPARADVLHYSVPFGVGYPVAVWQWG